MPKENEGSGTSLPTSIEDLKGMTPDEMRNMITVIDAHLESLDQTDAGELRHMSDEEEEVAGQLVEVRDFLMKRIERHNKMADIVRNKPERVKQVMVGLRTGLPDGGTDVQRLTSREARDHALRSLEDRLATDHMKDYEKEQVSKAIRSNPRIARRVLVTENDDYRNAWMKLVTEPHPFLDDDEQRAVRRFNEYRAASENTTTAGGFGVPVFIDPSIIMTAQGSGNPFLQIANQVEINTNVWKGITSAGVSWSFDTEAAAVSDDAPTLAQPSITVHMARGYIPYSIEVGTDYPGFASEMTSVLSQGYDELLVDKFTRGSGTGEPKGVLTAISATAGDRVYVTTAGSIGAPDPYKVWAALPQRFRRSASWLMSVEINNAIRQLGTANVYHAFTDNLPVGWTDTLFNSGVFESPYMPGTTTWTTTAAVAAIVGDFSGFTIVRNGGMNVELIPQVFDTSSGRPTGQRGWFAYSRVGSDASNTAAFRALVIGAT